MRSRNVPRWLIVVLSLFAVVAAGGGYALWRAVRPPSVSSFYKAPSSVGSDKPGQILRTEKIGSQVADARLWRILYTSTDLNGKVVATSALVAAPTAAAPDGGYPLIAVAHGTVGINQACAPSIKPFAKADEQNTAYDFFVGQYVRAGYAVVMSDFEGLGVKGSNSYLVGDVEGRNVLDAARAAKTFSGFNVRPGILVAGQSQGGHAALWAGQLAPSYAPDIHVIGLVAQAPATDLEAMFVGVTTAGRRGGIVSLPVMAADAYTKQYPAVKIGQVLTKRGRGSLNNVIKRLCLFPAILGTQLARPQDLLQPNGLDVLKPYVIKNIPGVNFTMPIFLAQGDSDIVVQPSINRAYAAKLCAAGADLVFKQYPGVGHFDVVGASTPDVLAWMSAIRNGTPPPTTCGGSSGR